MKRTLVVHSERSKNDVKIWLKKKNIEKEYEPVMAIKLDGEVVMIVEKSRLTKLLYCDKLVLFGEFTELNLSNLIKFVKFD